jgi:UDP-N-acetylglucosamine 2-epimerase (non-hydrolysing)
MFGLVAYYNNIEVVHIEAGLRTYNNYSPFPDEVNRKIISQFATLHFCPTDGLQSFSI